MTKYYLDSCIWRDYFEDRNDGLRPLGEWAFQLIKKIISEEDTILCSSLIRKELGIRYSQKEIENIFSVIPAPLKIEATISQSQLREAVVLSRRYDIPRADALHAILARDNGAILVSQDKHFANIPWAKQRMPQELI